MEMESTAQIKSSNFEACSSFNNLKPRFLDQRKVMRIYYKGQWL
jgi:hypothetical protein